MHLSNTPTAYTFSMLKTSNVEKGIRHNYVVLYYARKLPKRYAKLHKETIGSACERIYTMEEYIKKL